MALLYNFVRNKWSAPPLSALDPALVAGKTVLVTGANSGVGLGAATHYARLGAARLVLAVRSQAKGDAARRSIEEGLRGRKEAVPQMDVWLLDLASFASVRAFAARAAAELPRLDVAVLNAAVLKRSFAKTGDGWEESVQVNALATVLLGLLLLPKMESTADAAAGGDVPRLQFVASEAHTYIGEREAWLREANFYDALNKPESWTSLISHYSASKLFLVYCVREIAARVPTTQDGGHKVIVNYSCPGACQSELPREFNGSWWERNFVWYVQYATFYKTAEEGGRTLVYATCLGGQSHGKWVRKNGFDKPGILVSNERGLERQKKVWDETLEILKTQAGLEGY